MAFGMLVSLRIRNFKSLADTSVLNLRPLTFLLGPNSSGKTSILQSLLLLRQTIDSRDIKNPLATNGSYVQLGPYREMIFRHDIHNNLGIELSLLPQTPMPLPELGTERAVRPEKVKLDFRCDFGYNKKAMSVFVRSLSYLASPLSESLSKPLGLQVVRTPANRLRGTLTQGDVTKDLGEGTLSKFDSFTPPVRRRGPEKYDPFLAYLARQFAGLLEDVLSKLFYLGPIREPPRRLYAAGGQAPQDVGLRGELSVDALWARSHRKRERERLLGPVSQWMKAFGIADRVELRRLGGLNYWIDLTDPYLGLRVNLADVGFGASQVLPIVVEGFYAPFESTLLVEQPEIHLHPRAQALLGDLFLDIIREGGVKQMIVETHSEHLIGRLQRRIAEGKVKRSQVAVYYCAPSPEGTHLSEIGLDETGAFREDSIPPGFFEEAFEESKARFEATLGSTAGGTGDAPKH